MPSMDDLMKTIPVSSIAQKLGVDEATAREAVQMAVPTMLGGMEANAKTEQGAQSLAGALERHGANDLGEQPDLSRVDAEDGQKIVRNVFGDNHEEVADTLAAAPNPAINSDLIKRLMPMIAPLVLSFVGRQFLGRKGAVAGAGAGMLGELLGGMMGGRGGAGQGAGGMLGELLGGKGGNAMSSIIGGLLGAGKR